MIPSKLIRRQQADSSPLLLFKVEPSRRAYEELNALAVITGRRRSQGGDRASIPIIEVDGTGLIKINPLANWTFKETKSYIDANNVPYNALLDRGYTSIGDWHSTKTPDGSAAKGISADAAERSGRWAGRAEKTECGLHKDYFKMKAQFNKRKREREQRARDEARGTPLNPEAASAEDKDLLAAQASQAVTSST
jgi:phosphoadenosine phosphosulfate reductase